MNCPAVKDCAGLDYYPFGMLMPGRNFSSTSGYRYGFNGQENSDEIAAGLTTALYWEYDSRIGRRWNVDPKQKVYESPYVCFSDNPILLSDPNGDKAGDPPGTLYHNTEAGKNVFTKGFDGTTHGKYSSYNWFSTTADASGTGRTGTGVTIGVEGVNVKNASTITNAQSDAWNVEALKEMGYKDKNAFNKAQKTMSKEAYSELYNEWRGRVNSKIGGYMDNMKQASYYLERDGTYAVTDALANSGTIKTLNASSAVVKTLNGLKWGGRALIVVAVAKDLYDIYNSEDKARTIVKKAGFWAGAWAGGAAAGVGYAATGLDLTGPWGWVGHGVTTLVGGIAGGFAGEAIAETVYDHIVTKGAKPGMK